MRILVTRPSPDGERTAAGLRARGHDVVLAPLLTVERLPDAPLGPGPWAAVLLTSANAARAVAVHLRRDELLPLPVLAVGRHSAEAARAAGFAVVTSADGDADDLAQLAAARFAGTHRALLYLTGEDRARDLAAVLAPKGLRVETVAVYRAVKAMALPAAAAAELAAGRIDGVLHFSARSAESYLQCTTGNREQALAPVQYCLSERAARPLRVAGAARIRVALRPDEASLLALVTARPA